MKKLLLITAMAFMGIAVCSAQVVSNTNAEPSQSVVTPKTSANQVVNYNGKAMTMELFRTARQATLTQNPSVTSRSELKAGPRRAYSDNVLMGRPEGSFYTRGSLQGGGSFTAVTAPPFTDFTFFNYCQDKAAAVWAIGGEVTEGNEDNDLDLFIPKGTSSSSLFYAPSISVGSVTDQMVDFIEPIDSCLYAFNYLNTVKTGYYYFSNGSPFMTEDIPFDFDDDGVDENYKSAGIRQFFLEKPVQPLNLYDIYLPFYSSLEKPLKEDQTLKCIIRKVEVDDEGYYLPGEVLATMEATADDLLEEGALNDTYYDFYAVFANYEEDEFGTQTAAPVILDDMFVIDVLGFDNEGTDIQLYGAFLHQDDNEFYTNRTRATRIVLSNPDGTEFTGGTLAYYNPEAAEPYGYCAIMFLEGEMDGLYVDSHEIQVAPVEGGESGDPDSKDAPVYLFTNYPIFETIDGEFEWAYNYDFEGLPDWADIKIDPSYYENEEYADYRGLHMVWFDCEPLPAGVEGRKAEISIISARGAVCETKIILRQGILPEDRYEATYAMEVGETHTSGESVDVENALGDVVATLQFGFAGQDDPDFKAAVADNSVPGFAAYTEGNGANGRKTSGTAYVIAPKYDGEIEVAVKLDAGKQFFVLEDGTALSNYNGIKEEAEYKGTYKFNVSAGKTYTVYASGSKLGFYGFNYTITGAIEDGIQLVNNGDATVNRQMYNLQGQRISTPANGLYIMNGRKYIVR